jgi:hypothetical protein
LLALGKYPFSRRASAPGWELRFPNELLAINLL